MSTLLTFLIPLTNDPQEFQIQLAGSTYTLTVRWNDIGQYWLMDIGDQNNNPLAASIPFVTGADLLSGLEYLGISGSFLVLTNGQMPDSIPTYNNLGTDSNLYFQTSSSDE